jgi:pyruvate dehydrogenase E2 component (dihydrolipoamide acetyltransferase)
MPVADGGDKGGRIFASPLARRMAKQAGIDLSGLSGSGPHGRIVKADIDAAIAQGAPAAAETVPSAAAPARVAGPAPSGPGAKQLADLLGMSYRLEPPDRGQANHPAFLSVD